MTPLNVLIVDDEFLVAEFLGMLVEDAGHRVAGVAASAEEALAALGRGGVDFAVLDIRLPGERDGIELAHEIRRRSPEVRYLFVTGSGEAATRARAERAEPLAILQKPIDEAAFARLLREAAGAPAARAGGG